jgi:hypothetical protein
VAEAVTLRNMLLIVWIAPLCGGGMVVGGGVMVGSLGLELREKVSPARLLAWASERGRMHRCGRVDTCRWWCSG